MDDSSEYLLSIRAMKEQTVVDKEENYRLKTVADGGMNSSMFQNPTNPDVTYRSKAEKEYRGYTVYVSKKSMNSVIAWSLIISLSRTIVAIINSLKMYK